MKILPDALEEVVKLLLKQGSYSLKNSTVFSSWTENASLRFDVLEDCLMKAYVDKLLAPLNYTVLKTNFPWVLADLVTARLALDLYLELYKKITAKANPNDSGIFVRGFSPFRADQMAFIFYAEDEDIPCQHARLHDHFSLPGRHGYAIGIACDLHAMAQRLGASLHRPRKRGTVSNEARQIFEADKPRDGCRTSCPIL